MKFLNATVALMAAAASAKELQLCFHQGSGCAEFSENCFAPVLGQCQRVPEQMVPTGLELYYHAEYNNDELTVKGYSADDKECKGELLVSPAILPFGQCVTPEMGGFKAPFLVQLTRDDISPSNISSSISSTASSSSIMSSSSATSSSATSSSMSTPSPTSTSKTNAGVSLTPRIVASALAMVAAMLL